MLGIEPTAMRQWLPVTRLAVGEGDDDAVALAAHGLRAGPGQDLHAAAAERLLQHLGGVRVLAGQHPVAAGDEDDLGAERQVGRGELRPGDAGADDDEALGQLGQVVQLAPVEDPLAVGHGGVQPARGGADGEQHGSPPRSTRVLPSGAVDLDVGAAVAAGGARHEPALALARR